MLPVVFLQPLDFKQRMCPAEESGRSIRVTERAKALKMAPTNRRLVHAVNFWYVPIDKEPSRFLNNGERNLIVPLLNGNEFGNLSLLVLIQSIILFLRLSLN